MKILSSIFLISLSVMAGWAKPPIEQWERITPEEVISHIRSYSKDGPRSKATELEFFTRRTEEEKALVGPKALPPEWFFIDEKTFEAGIQAIKDVLTQEERRGFTAFKAHIEKVSEDTKGEAVAGKGVVEAQKIRPLFALFSRPEEGSLFQEALLPNVHTLLLKAPLGGIPRNPYGTFLPHITHVGLCASETGERHYRAGNGCSLVELHVRSINFGAIDDETIGEPVYTVPDLGEYEFAREAWFKYCPPDFCREVQRMDKLEFLCLRDWEKSDPLNKFDDLFDSLNLLEEEQRKKMTLAIVMRDPAVQAKFKSLGLKELFFIDPNKESDWVIWDEKGNFKAFPTII